MSQIPPPPGALPPYQAPAPPPAVERLAADVAAMRPWVIFIGVTFLVWNVLALLWFVGVMLAFS